MAGRTCPNCGKYTFLKRIQEENVQSVDVK